MNLTVRQLQHCQEQLELDSASLPSGLLDSQLCAGGGDSRDTCQASPVLPYLVCQLPALPGTGSPTRAAVLYTANSLS